MSLANYPPDHPGHKHLIRNVAKGFGVTTKFIECEDAVWVIATMPTGSRVTLGRIAYLGDWLDECFAVRYTPGNPGKTCDTFEEAMEWVVNGEVTL